MDLKRNRVENTNDCAVVSKHSMSSKGYANDPFLKYFVSNKDQQRSRSPLINRFYCLRFKAIEYAFNRFNDLNLIISIGCGFDTSSLRYPNICFIEIDFPIVAINKAKIVAENQLISLNQNSILSENLSETKEPFVVLKSDNYCLIGADLRKYNDLKILFIKENLIRNDNKESKVCLFNECSLCYLEKDITDNLIQVFTDLYRDKCHSITYLGFEQLRPLNHLNDGFSRVMLNHFKTIGSPLKTFLTKSEIITRFKLSLNFDWIQVLDMKSFFNDYIQTNEKQRINSLEMFDEWEEFDAVCSCYALTIAQTIPQTISDENYVTNNSYKRNEKQIKAIPKQIEKSSLLFRFGHSSCLTNDNKVLIFGGFGSDSDRNHTNNIRNFHKRLSNFIEINPKTDEIISYKFCDKNHEIQGIHSQIVELKDNLFLVCGGRLSPSSILDNKIVKLMDDTKSYEIQSHELSFNSIPKVFRHLNLKHKDSNKVIRFGGKHFDNLSEDNIYYCLDTNSMKWNQQIKRKLFSGIHSHSGTTLNSNVWLTNGGINCDTNDFISNSLNLIDERSPEVNYIHCKSLKHLYSHSMKCFNENKILIIGGMAKTGPNNTIDLFDMRCNKIIESFDVLNESISMLINFTSEIVFINEPELWLIGGGGNCFSFGTHFNQFSSIGINHLII